MREGAACEAARHAPWAGRGYSAGCGQMHRSVGRGVPGISATAPVTIGEGSITGGWGGDFEIDYWSLLPAGVRVCYLLSTSSGAAAVVQGHGNRCRAAVRGICEVTPRVLRRCAHTTAPPPALCVPCFMRVALDAW